MKLHMKIKVAKLSRISACRINYNINSIIIIIIIIISSSSSNSKKSKE